MLRRALVLSLVLAGACSYGEVGAARTVSPVGGEVRALALTGDALTVARLPPRGGMTVERVVTAAAPQRLLSTSLRDVDDLVFIAGSAQALAIGLQAGGADILSASRAFVGPAAGPLREVAVCRVGLLAPPVAVAGGRIAWRDGACGDPPDGPTAITPAAIMVGAADPAFAPERIALERDLLPVAIVLAGNGGLVGALRPSFFSVDSEVRGFGSLATAGVQLAERGRIVAPVGVLSDGTRVFSLARLDAGDDGAACPNTLFTMARGQALRRPLDVGGCPLGADVPAGPSAARAVGGRIFALVAAPATVADSGRPPLVSLVSMRSDAGDRRVHAQGSYRAPLGLATDGDRLAYWHERCTPADGSDVVVIDDVREDSGPGTIASCRATILTRSARVRDGVVAVRLHCPSGCTGAALDVAGESPRRLRSFSFGPGTHALTLALARAVLRRGQLRLQLAVEGGPARSALIRLRR